MKIFVYSMRNYDELPYFKKFSDVYSVPFDYVKEAPSLDNLSLAKGYEAISVVTTPVDAEMLDKMHELGIKYLGTRTIGYDHIDIEYARQLGIRVAHAKYSPDSVANYAIALILSGCRKINLISSQFKKQDYSLKGKMGIEISNATVGVIGTGAIGKTVIKRLYGFGCRILAYDIYPNDEVRKYAEYVDLEHIYQKSDIITLHAPATKDNYHMLNEKAFSKMKDGVIIVNCARGALIHTEALLNGLDSGKIGFAGLDVLENEEYLHSIGEDAGEECLRVLKKINENSNVVLTPHTAFYTALAVSDMVESCIQGIISLKKDEETFKIK
ncbi:NAD(P)-dependent oxidoreductase [Clostridium sp. Marseille-P2415]|uniref:NAD(P)-dependent oxidoreductase n=1 Tax=Clostridium sp. Marseille-P2415 TaxID=1805471 RepID=UPI0009886EC1|nr:NAD(P)-dependent oxidoreductase [Clostridium sp. Marseille-P2415]